MPRKNQLGRKPTYDKKVVEALRDKSNFSYQEIADKLGMKSRQLARYYYLRSKIKKWPTDKIKLKKKKKQTK